MQRHRFRRPRQATQAYPVRPAWQKLQVRAPGLARQLARYPPLGADWAFS